jgi:hypothetical protein
MPVVVLGEAVPAVSNLGLAVDIDHTARTLSNVAGPVVIAFSISASIAM